MPPRSPGRKPKWTPIQLKQAWKDFKAQHPTGTKKAFAKIVDMSYSRIKAIINDHPSELKRKNKNKRVHELTTKELGAERKFKASGLQFYPDNGWDGWG
jgi:hypothetical protein